MKCIFYALSANACTYNPLITRSKHPKKRKNYQQQQTLHQQVQVKVMCVWSPVVIFQSAVTQETNKKM